MHDTRVHCWNVGLENKRIQASREGITRAFPNGKELTTEHKNKIADSLKGRMPKNIALLHSPEIEKRA